MRKMISIRVLQDVLSLKIKTRHDGYCDQYNRLFMTKILLVSSIIMGYDFFTDRVNCMVSKDNVLSKDFIHSACWISGLYIFEEMRYKLDKSGYYGIGQRVDYDGINRITGSLCQTKDLNGYHENCITMTRMFYLHYQWMPFYIASLAVLFYIPYIFFLIVNTDLVSLKKAIKSVSNDTDLIVRNYFNYSINSLSQLRMRIWWNICVKTMYVFLSVSSFFMTDYLLNGKYLTYGRDFLDWSDQNNTMQHGLVKKRQRPKAGNILLPSMGYCDIHEASLDTRTAFHNESRFICEISPHILYQYVLMVLWFFFVAGIIVSVSGWVNYVIIHLYHMLCFGKFCCRKTIYQYLTLREIEYLQYMKKKNLVQYGAVLRKLKETRYEMVAVKAVEDCVRLNHEKGTHASSAMFKDIFDTITHYGDSVKHRKELRNRLTADFESNV